MMKAYQPSVEPLTINTLSNRLKVVFLIQSLLVASLFILLHGYRFNTDDQAEHLPQVYQMQDHSLYQGDYFVSHLSETFSLRTFYVWFVHILSYFLPVSVICFVFTLLCIAASVYSFMIITKTFSNQPWAPFLTGPFVFLIFNSFTVGGNHIAGESFICSTMAMAFASMGLMQFFKNRFLSMAVLIGIGTLFQVLDAAQLFFLLLVLMISGRKKFSLILKTIIIYILFSGAMLLPMLYHQFFSDYIYDHKQYAQILFFFRNAHHFVPTAFPLHDMIRFVLLLTAGIWALFRSGLIEKKNHIIFVGTVLLLTFLYILLFQILGIYAIGKTQWFKSTLWVSALCSVYLAIWIAPGISVLFSNNVPFRFINAGSIVLILIGLFFILDSAQIPLERFQGKYMVGNYRKTDLQKLHEWIERNTSKDDLFLAPPDDFSFACEAKRPLVIGYKAIIHEPFFMIPWYEKYREIYGSKLDGNNSVDALGVAVENYQEMIKPDVLNKYKVRCKIDNIRTSKFPIEYETVLHTEGDWVVTKVPENDFNGVINR